MTSEVNAVLSGERRWHVHAGDGLALARELPEACCVVIADPPYDARTHAGVASSAGGTVKRIGVTFAPLDGLGFVPDMLRASRSWVLCFCAIEMLGDYRRAAPKAYLRGGIWHRPDGAPQFTGDRPAQACEGIAIFHRPGRPRWNGGGSRGIWTHGVERIERCHETQKPVALMRELVELFTSPGDLVYDPTCGSGTTGVAALALGRRFLGAEIDPVRHAIAVERLTARAAGNTLAAARAEQTMLPLAGES